MQRTKRVEFCVFVQGAAPGTTDGYVKAELPRQLNGVRAVWLMSYNIVGATDTVLQLRLGRQVFVDQENAFGQPGYMVLAGTERYGGAPRLISKHGIPQLTELDITLLTRTGAPAVFTDAAFFFEFEFDVPEDHHSIGAVAAEQGHYEVVHGTNNWRTAPSKQTQDQTVAQLAAGVFSHSPF
jgi:hypothetical protein